MKPRPETERLLDDVLGGDDAGFRDSVFGETMRAARHRREIRRLRRAASALVVIAALVLVWWRNASPRQQTQAAEKKAYELVTSRPLPASALVVTRPLAADEVVASFANVEIIQAASGQRSLREIDDGQLLSLLGSTPAALVRHASHEAELVFVYEADEQQFLRN